MNDSLEYDNKTGEGGFSDVETFMAQIANRYDDVDYVTPYPGCMNEAYEEYNPMAETEDNRLCHTEVVAVRGFPALDWKVTRHESKVTFHFRDPVATGTPVRIYDIHGQLAASLEVEHSRYLAWEFGEGPRGVFLVMFEKMEKIRPLKLVL